MVSDFWLWPVMLCRDPSVSTWAASGQEMVFLL